MERARRSIQYQQRIIAEQTKTLQDWLELDELHDTRRQQRRRLL